MSQDLKSVIEAAWEARDGVNTGTTGEVREAVEETLNQLDAGTLRVASRGDDGSGNGCHHEMSAVCHE